VLPKKSEALNMAVVLIAKGNVRDANVGLNFTLDMVYKERYTNTVFSAARVRRKPTTSELGSLKLVR